MWMMLPLSSDRSSTPLGEVSFSIKGRYGGRVWYLALVGRAVRGGAKLFGGAKLPIFVGPSKRGVVSFARMTAVHILSTCSLFLSPLCARTWCKQY